MDDSLYTFPDVHIRTEGPGRTSADVTVNFVVGMEAAALAALNAAYAEARRRIEAKP
jgi:hypothetical protein